MMSSTSGRLSAHQRISRDVAARALWAAFPAKSENELCVTAARVLGTSENTVRRIVRKETDAKWSILYPLFAMALAAKGISALEVLEGAP